MKLEITRQNVKGYFVNYLENDHMILGFTEKNFTIENLVDFIRPLRVVELKQVHSNIILNAADIRPPETEGDGILLTEKGTLAIIKTADCTPLFCWNDTYSIGGVIHIGWRGLQQGIEKNWLHMLAKQNIDPQTLSFLLGPAIEKECYEVGSDVYDAFANTCRQDEFFTAIPGRMEKKYRLDVKSGIILSLTAVGIAQQKIVDVAICTFCAAERFPSYRREKGAEQRIYNFLLLK